MILLFPSNLGDGALAAFAMRRFTVGEPPVPSVRNAAVFLACAVAAPGLVSFVDAAIVTASGWANDYWLVWNTRFRSNVLTNLIWVPGGGDQREAGARLVARRVAAPVRRSGRARAVARGGRDRRVRRRGIDGDDAAAVRAAAAVPVGSRSLRNRRCQRGAVDVLRAGDLERDRRTRAVFRRDSRAEHAVPADLPDDDRGVVIAACGDVRRAAPGEGGARRQRIEVPRRVRIDQRRHPGHRRVARRRRRQPGVLPADRLQRRAGARRASADVPAPRRSAAARHVSGRGRPRRIRSPRR